MRRDRIRSLRSTPTGVEVIILLDNQSSESLGQLLLQHGVITPEQLQQALKSQQESDDEQLGETLVKMDYCTEVDIAQVVAEQLGVRWVSLESYSVDPVAMATITPEYARKYGALPIGFEDDRLVVAMKRPGDIVALDDLQVLTGFEIEPVVAADSQIDMYIERYIHHNMDVQQTEDEQLDVAEEIDEEDEEVDRPAVQLANMIITQAVSSGATDVHIEVYEDSLRIRFRIDGVLHDIMHPQRRLHAALVSRIKVMANMDIAERRVPQDGRMTLNVRNRVIDVRVASLPTTFGERLTLRLLDRSAKMLTLQDLGVSDDMLQGYENALRLPYGFILVTGPTGSGKSTTLYASLNTLDREEKNIITLEDPIERRVDEISQVQINPKAGLTFASGLRSILRCDPDVIMVGEIRDAETARTSIESALTGHLVFATLHTNDSAGAISRLTEMGIEPYLTASSLACVVAQRLARVLCPECKQSYQMPREHAEEIEGFPLEPHEEEIDLFRAKTGGCAHCHNTGYQGRIGVFEILTMSEQMQAMTLQRESSAELKRQATSEGMKTLRRDGLDKVRQGITSVEEVMRVVL